jgi:autophagy-related protein 2
MAAFFESFRSSAMPKRLLRYAMARLDIFEDDALDLDNLDAALGLRNTFEFKDVGLKVEVRLSASASLQGRSVACRFDN